MRLNELFYKLNEGYKEAQQEFTLAANNDEQGVKDLIQAYKELIAKNQIKDAAERNIDHWRKQGFEAFKKFVMAKQSVPTSTAIKRKKLPGKSITLKETDEWLVVIPLDKQASCFHGKDSDWCTTKPNQPYFERYFMDREVTLIYCLNKMNAGMWAIAAHPSIDEIEMFDQRDNSIDADTFRNQTGLWPTDLVAMALKTHGDTVSSSRKPYYDAMSMLRKVDFYEGDFSKPNTEIEKALLLTLDPKYCERYTRSRFFTSGSKPITLPRPIIMAMATHSTANALECVEFNSLPDSFVLQILKQPGAYLQHILQSGYKPSQQQIDNIVGLASWSTAFEHIRRLLQFKLVPSDAVIIPAIKNEYYADDIAAAYISSKIIPSDKVLEKILHEYPDAMVEMLKLGATPSDHTLVEFVCNPDTDPSAAIDILAKHKIKISPRVLINAIRDAENTPNPKDEVMRIFAMMIINDQVPPDDDFEYVDKEHIPAILELIKNRGLKAPQHLL